MSMFYMKNIDLYIFYIRIQSDVRYSYSVLTRINRLAFKYSVVKVRIARVVKKVVVRY